METHVSNYETLEVVALDKAVGVTCVAVVAADVVGVVVVVLVM